MQGNVWSGFRVKSLLVLVLSVNIVNAFASEAPPLYYKHLKYLERSQQTTGVLSQVMLYEKRHQLGQYAEEASLLKARLFIDKGLYLSAIQVLDTVISNKTTAPGLLNEAHFYLGKSFYHQSKIPQALAMFELVDGPLDDEMRAELQHLTSLCFMQQGQYQKAAQYLQNNWWNAPGVWDLYARVNLAVALIHIGKSVQGADLLKQLGERKYRDNESKAVADRANQMLGYLLLSENRPENARQALEKISRDGTDANLALLGQGWASVQLGEYQRALGPWGELHQKDIRDIAVQESLLAYPYALRQMGNTVEAGRYYKQAMDRYRVEIRLLVASLQSLETKQLMLELQKLDEVSGQAWHASIRQASNGQALRYIQQLINDAEYFRLLNLYREARLLQYNVDKKLEKIDEIQGYLSSPILLEKKIIKNRETLRDYQARASSINTRSLQLRNDAKKNASSIAASLKQRTFLLLQQRKKQLESYLIQAQRELKQSQQLGQL